MDDDREVRVYVAYKQHIKRLLDLSGLWPLENAAWWYRMLPYVQIIMGCLTTIKIGHFIAHNITSIRVATRGLSIMTSIILNMIRVICLWNNREILIELRKILDNYYDELLRDETTRKLALHKVILFRRISLIYETLVFFAVFGYVLTPLIIIINQQIRHIQPVQYLPILLGKYPWHVPENLFNYSLYYILEASTLFSVWHVTCGTDTYLPFLVFQINGLLRVMSHRLTNFQEKHNIDEEMANCIGNYTTLMKCRDILEKTFGPIILVLMSNNAIVLCTVIFQFTKMESITPVQMIQFASYTCGKTTQTFLYSWAGTLLTSKSDNYLDAVYATNWYGNRKIMGAVFITLFQRPLTMKAWHMSEVSVNMFVMVLNTTLSYFLLLQTFEED